MLDINKIANEIDKNISIVFQIAGMYFLIGCFVGAFITALILKYN